MSRRRADGGGIADRLTYACALTQFLFDDANAPVGAGGIGRRDVARRLLDAGGDATAILTGSTHAPVMVNAAWRALLGSSARELPRAGLPATTIGALDEIARTGERVSIVDLELGADARRRCATVVFERLHGPRGAIDGAIIAWVDSDRSGRRPGNRRADQLLARVSHELHGTLSTMRLWDGVLRDDALDAELRRYALDALHQSVVLQSKLVADLFDVSRAIAEPRTGPRAPAMSERRAPERPAKSSASSLAGIRVLVVDDDAHVRDAFAVLLARSGAIVETADSARSARQLVAGVRFDAWVCDIAMPGEDGYELVRMLRAGGDPTPAIALTAHATVTDAKRARDAGFDLHAAKPIELDRLITSIQTVVAARASGG